MRKNLRFVLLGVALVFALGCSTTARFKVPENSKLYVDDDVVMPDANGFVKTRPYFWSRAGGIRYTLKDNEGVTVSQGKLKSRFRVVSIFWPPFALIYWPMGFSPVEYNLVEPADGIYVRPATGSAAPAAKAPAKAKPTQPVDKKKTK